MKNFIIVEKEKEDKYIPIKGMTFNGYEAAIKTCVRLSTIHKGRYFFVYDKVHKVQYHLEKITGSYDQ